MILHLVTDRRRLAPGRSDADAVACLVEQAGYAVAAGIDVIQLRERDLDSRRLVQLTSTLVALSRGSTTRIVVNERLDVALAAGADGVHLRGDSLAAATVRELAPPGFLVGRSVRSIEETRHAGPVDYLIAGTIFPSGSKPPEHPLLGLDGLAAIVTASLVPVLGIGGIGADRLQDLHSTGAAGVAAIGAFMGTGDCGAVPLHDLARRYRERFPAANMGNCP